MIEICLLVYKRHYRLNNLLTQLKQQTYKDFKLNIWNNDPSLFVDTSYLSPKQIKIYNSFGDNIGSQARFRLVPLTSGNPIIFIDDDLDLDQDFVEYYYNKWLEYGKMAMIGWWSKLWTVENYHNSIDRLLEGIEVDYLGTGGMIADRWIFDKELSLQNIPEQYAQTEDLYLSYIARKNGMKLYSSKQKCRIVYNGKDQGHELKEYKQNAFLSLRKEGWRLIYEN